MPLFASAVVILLVLPGVVAIAIAAQITGADDLFFVKPWLGGLSLGLAVSVMYYRKKEGKRLKAKWSIGSDIKEPK